MAVIQRTPITLKMVCEMAARRAFVVVPIVGPVLLAMGLDPVWLGIMIAINLQTSFLTPPFGFALFYLRGVAPPEVTTPQIYRGVIPFVAIQLIALLRRRLERTGTHDVLINAGPGAGKTLGALLSFERLEREGRRRLADQRRRYRSRCGSRDWRPGPRSRRDGRR